MTVEWQGPRDRRIPWHRCVEPAEYCVTLADEATFELLDVVLCDYHTENAFRLRGLTYTSERLRL
jgi:hypothetical protein